MLPPILQSIAPPTIVIRFYALDFALIHSHDKKRQSSRSGGIWDFTLFIFAMVAVLTLQSVLLPALSSRTTAAWERVVQIIGILSVLIAMSLDIWSRARPQQSYAERVEAQPEHNVIDTVPYNLIRHPVITSFFGMTAGLFLINPALTTLAALLYTVRDFSRAAKQEGALVSATLPGYADSARRPPDSCRAFRGTYDLL